MIRAAMVVLLLCASCTVPSIEELNCDGSDSLSPDDVAGGDADAVLGDSGACSALRVSLTYATFQPGCLTLTVVDLEDASRTESQGVKVVPGVRSDTRTVAVFGRARWSRNLRLKATAHERSCNGPVVAEQFVEAQVPTEGIVDASLDLRAEDLDDDGYVSATGTRPGTDCDDSKKDVNPQATEQCGDGIDNNCVNGENDAPDAQAYYPDEDGDSYGNKDAVAIPSCVQPARTATRGGDCNDGDALIRPDQTEFRCDGVDDDCDGATDDDAFAVGTMCRTAQDCPGANACQSVSSAACISAETPTPWYVDEDGDGRRGTELATRCTAPSPGASTTKDDCDESSRYVANSSTLEVCDRMDNDCDGQRDEDLTGCATAPWPTATDVGGAGTTWNAVAPHNSNQGWLAGDGGRVMHVNINVYTPVTSCPGNWRSAWAANSGRVFLGSDAGKLATATPDALATCTQVNGPGTSSISSMVGFEDGTTVRLFAVDSAGRVIRWVYVEGATSQTDPEVLTQILPQAGIGTTNLRAIHGLSPETLLAVGMEPVSGTDRPAAWRAPASGTTWQKETLGIPAATTGYLRAVRVVTPKLAYVAGDKGLLLARSGTTWTTQPALTVSGTAVDLRAMLAFGRTAIYAVSSGPKDIHFFDGTSWSSATNVPPSTLNALAATGPGDIWATGNGGTLIRWKP